MFIITLISPGLCFSDENTSGIALKLIGTVVNTSGNSMAVIEDNTCLARLVREKEFIPDLGTIKKIETKYQKD